MSNSKPGNVTALSESNATWKFAYIFVRISLTANTLVLIPVCIVLIAYSNSELVVNGLGPFTAARGILLSIYFAILVDSVILLALHVYFVNRTEVEYMVAALLVT